MEVNDCRRQISLGREYHDKVQSASFCDVQWAFVDVFALQVVKVCIKNGRENMPDRYFFANLD